MSPIFGLDSEPSLLPKDATRCASVPFLYFVPSVVNGFSIICAISEISVKSSWLYLLLSISKPHPNLRSCYLLRRLLELVWNLLGLLSYRLRRLSRGTTNTELGQPRRLGYQVTIHQRVSYHHRRIGCKHTHT